MNKRVAVGLVTAVAIAVTTGPNAGRNAFAAAVGDQKNSQQSQDTMENKASEIGKKLDELEQRMKTAKAEAKADMTRQMDELREMQKELQNKLKEMKTASGKALQDAKAGAQSAMDDLQKAYEKARTRFGEITE